MPDTFLSTWLWPSRREIKGHTNNSLINLISNVSRVTCSIKIKFVKLILLLALNLNLCLQSATDLDNYHQQLKDYIYQCSKALENNKKHLGIGISELELWLVDN